MWKNNMFFARIILVESIELYAHCVYNFLYMNITSMK